MTDWALDMYGIAYHNPYKLAWLLCGLALAAGKIATARVTGGGLALFLVASAAGIARGSHAWSNFAELVTSSTAFLAAAWEISRLSQRPHVRRPLLVTAFAFASAFALVVATLLPRYSGYSVPLFAWRLYPAAACWGACLGVVALQVGAPIGARIRVAFLGLWMGCVCYVGLQNHLSIEQWFRISAGAMATEAFCLAGWWWATRDQLLQRGELATQ